MRVYFYTLLRVSVYVCTVSMCEWREKAYAIKSRLNDP